MNRRGITVLLGCLLLALLTIQVGRVRVPYVELGPGPTVDTLGVSDGKPVIAVKNGPTTRSAGQLRLVTVSVQPDLTLLQALRDWWDRSYAVVPRELIYPPEKTEKQVDADNTREFHESQSSAETSALRELGYPVDVTVTEVTKDFPAAGTFAAGDVIRSMDSQPVTSVARLASLVRDKPPGASRTVTFRRDGVERTVTVTTGKGEGGSARLGVSAKNSQPHPFELQIQLDRIGGPSAGLMFSLGIIDTVESDDLTGGMIIAGTGSIDDDGKVGPIGGIRQKLIAAQQSHAAVFLTPADNCKEALGGAPSGLALVKVSSLHDALDALRALREHRPAPHCGS